MALYNDIVSFKDANGADNTMKLFRIGDTRDYYHFEIENPGGSPRISREDRKRLADALYQTLDREPLDEDKGLKFNEVFQRVETADDFKTGDKVRLKAVKLSIPYGAGDEGTIVDPIMRPKGKVWVHVPGKVTKGHGYQFSPDDLERIEEPAETAAEAVEEPNRPTTYGEVIETALTRLDAAADALTDGMFVSEQDAELAKALRLIVAAMLISPRGEKALRKIVGE